MPRNTGAQMDASPYDAADGFSPVGDRRARARPRQPAAMSKTGASVIEPERRAAKRAPIVVIDQATGAGS